jgi:glycosyltransferase involved in cell wall biosynthesis
MLMRHIKVLIVMHGAGSGGVEKSLLTLCSNLNKEIFEPIVVLPASGPLKTSLDTIGVKTCISPVGWWTPIRFHFNDAYYYRFLAGLKRRTRNLVDLIESNSIDIVHSSTLTIADGAIAAKLAGRPHIWHLHGNFTGADQSPFGSYWPVDVLYGMVGELSARVAAVSNTVKNYVAKYIPLEQIDVIHNGIDLDEFDRLAAQPCTLFSELPQLKNKFLIGLVGRIAKVKGTLDFVETAAKIAAARNEICFLVIGHPQEQEYVKQVNKRVLELNLQDRIIFMGARADVPSLLRQLNLLVLSSLKEGFSYSCLEGMAAGIPVISTRCGGAEELVVDGKTGKLVLVGDVDQLAEAILGVIGDQSLMTGMGQAGRLRAEQDFSGRKCAERFENLYQDIVRGYRSERSSRIWADVFMGLATDLGVLGTRIQEHERLIQGLKDFEGLFKNNVFYRALRSVYQTLSPKKGIKS